MQRSRDVEDVLKNIRGVLTPREVEDAFKEVYRKHWWYHFERPRPQLRLTRCSGAIVKTARPYYKITIDFEVVLERETKKWFLELFFDARKDLWGRLHLPDGSVLDFPKRAWSVREPYDLPLEVEQVLGRVLPVVISKTKLYEKKHEPVKLELLSEDRDWLGALLAALRLHLQRSVRVIASHWCPNVEIVDVVFNSVHLERLSNNSREITVFPTFIVAIHTEDGKLLWADGIPLLGCIVVTVQEDSGVGIPGGKLWIVQQMDVNALEFRNRSLQEYNAHDYERYRRLAVQNTNPIFKWFPHNFPVFTYRPEIYGAFRKASDAYQVLAPAFVRFIDNLTTEAKDFVVEMIYFALTAAAAHAFRQNMV